MFNVSIVGLDEEMRQLTEQLPPSAQRAALLDGARVLQKEVVAAAPRLSGALARSIYARTGSANADPVARVVAAIPGKGKRMTNNAYYAHFLEYGTKKMNKHPFMVPALNRKRSEVMGAIQSRLVREVQGKK